MATPLLTGWPAERSPPTQGRVRLLRDANKIDAELLGGQGSPANLAGHHYLDRSRVDAVMRPSPTFNAALAALSTAGRDGTTDATRPDGHAETS